MAEAWAEVSGPGLKSQDLAAVGWRLVAGGSGSGSTRWHLANSRLVAWLVAGDWWLGPLMKTEELDWWLGVGNCWLEARGQVLAARGLRVFCYLVDWLDWLVGWLDGLLVACLIDQCSSVVDGDW